MVERIGLKKFKMVLFVFDDNNSHPSVESGRKTHMFTYAITNCLSNSLRIECTYSGSISLHFPLFQSLHNSPLHNRVFDSSFSFYTLEAQRYITVEVLFKETPESAILFVK